jgi:hypothetical protein
MTAGTEFAIAAPPEARQEILAALARAGWRATGTNRVVIAQPPASLDEHDLIELTFALKALGATGAFARDPLPLSSAAA